MIMDRPIMRGDHVPTKYNVVAIPYNVPTKDTTLLTVHMYLNVDSLTLSNEFTLTHCPSIFRELPLLLIVVVTRDIDFAEALEDPSSGLTYTALTDYTRNVSDVIARKRESNSSKISVVATCLYIAS